MTVPVLPILEDRRPPVGRLVGFVLFLAAVALGLAAFSAYPWVASAPGAAVLKVAFKHVAAFEEKGGKAPREELAKLPRHMQPQETERARTGRRRDTVLRVDLDGRRLLDRAYRPGGLRHDGPTFAYEEVAVPQGRHLLEAVISDAGDDAEDVERRRWALRQEVNVRPGHVLLIELAEDVGLTVR